MRRFIKKCRKSNLLMVLVAAMVIFTACEGPAGPEGPAGADGQDGAPGADGEDGNANVTVFIFDGNDFSTSPNITRAISNLSETEMTESSWDIYMNYTESGNYYYHIPGWGYAGDTSYRGYHEYRSTSSEVTFYINVISGPGENYSEIRVVRTAANNVVDSTTTKLGGDFQDSQVDFSNYQEVVDYYDIDSDDIVDMRSK